MIRITKFRVVANHSHGFTIIELMIATTIFSVILLLSATALIQMGRLYYRGVISSRTQETTRTIMDEISRTIQFGGGSTASQVAGQDRSFCVGGKRYSYILSHQLTDNATPGPNQKRNVLVTDTSAACTPQPLATTGPTGNYRELMNPHMRLARLDITPDPANNLYAIKLRVVYGDDDLLCSPSVPGDCSAIATSTSLGNNDLTCKSLRAGTQFCAVSELATVVRKRVR